jgi:hypothetical protein
LVTFVRPPATARSLREGDVSNRRKAPVADRRLGRLNWAESPPIEVASGKTGVRAIAVIPLRARNSLHRPEQKFRSSNFLANKLGGLVRGWNKTTRLCATDARTWSRKANVQRVTQHAIVALHAFTEPRAVDMPAPQQKREGGSPGIITRTGLTPNRPVENAGSIGIVWKARVMVARIFPASLRIAYRLIVAHPRAWVAAAEGGGAADTG